MMNTRLNHKRVRWSLLTVITLLATLLIVASCYSGVPGEGVLAQGDTLVIRIEELDPTSELRYPGGLNDGAHYMVTPSHPENELVMVRLSIWNNKAASAIFTLDHEAAELRGLEASEIYTPIDVDALKIETNGAHPNEERYARPIPGRPDQPASVKFLMGPVELAQGFMLQGWMVFEVPKKTKFREIKWKAGDSVFLKF